MVDLLPIAVRANAPKHIEPPSAELGLTWRPLASDDAPLLVTLLNTIELADGLPFRTSLAEVAEILATPSLDLGRDTLVGIDPRGEMRAWGAVLTTSGDETVVRAVQQGGVDPGWRGRGVGSAIVAWGTARARQLLGASGKEVPGRISVYLGEEQTLAEAVFRRAGYSPIRYYAELRRALGRPLDPVAPVAGVRIEPWPADDDAVRLAHNEAFADHWGSEPRSAEDWAGSRAMFAPAWSFVAIDTATDRIVGYLEAARYEHDWAVAGYSSGYIHLLGVLRPWRGQGLAKALLAATMAAQRAEGIEYAELGVDTANPSGAQDLYAALGFEAFRTETMLSIEL